MSRSALRVAGIVAMLVTLAYQMFAGAVTSLAWAAPGVDPGLRWLTDVLIYEAATLLPLGFVLCLWGSPWGLRGAGACAAASLLLGLVAAIAFGASDSPFFFLVLLVPPGAILLVGVAIMGASADEVA